MIGKNRDDLSTIHSRRIFFSFFFLNKYLNHCATYVHRMTIIENQTERYEIRVVTRVRYN